MGVANRQTHHPWVSQALSLDMYEFDGFSQAMSLDMYESGEPLNPPSLGSAKR